MIFTAASSFSDIEDRHVLDLGCGCGILSIASAIMGAASVVGVDLDEDALEVARANVEEAEAGEEVDLIRCDIAALAGDAPFRSRGDVFDTVVMNPPFGTKTKGIDMVFLEKGCQVRSPSVRTLAYMRSWPSQQIAKHAVYSLHKSSTRDHIERRAKAFGFKGQVLAEMRVCASAFNDNLDRVLNSRALAVRPAKDDEDAQAKVSRHTG